MSLCFIVSNMFTKSQKNYNIEETETRSEAVGCARVIARFLCQFSSTLPVYFAIEPEWNLSWVKADIQGTSISFQFSNRGFYWTHVNIDYAVTWINKAEDMVQSEKKNYFLGKIQLHKILMESSCALWNLNCMASLDCQYFLRCSFPKWWCLPFITNRKQLWSFRKLSTGA